MPTSSLSRESGFDLSFPAASRACDIRRALRRLTAIALVISVGGLGQFTIGTCDCFRAHASPARAERMNVYGAGKPKLEN
jgi:hypothetical protein